MLHLLTELLQQPMGTDLQALSAMVCVHQTRFNVRVLLTQGAGLRLGSGC
jgi:hypothetical protein